MQLAIECIRQPEFAGVFLPRQRASWGNTNKSLLNTKCRQQSRSILTKAVTKGELDDIEMHIAVTDQKMNTAAREERFKEAAEYRERLENLRLKQRCLQVEHTEGMRESICHHLGQVIQHKRYDYRGVIFGVHSTCQASEVWIQTMGVDRLPQGRLQPFYQVLVDERYRPGGMITYVAQENIILPEAELDNDSPIRHKLVAQMFTNFDQGSKRYEPTKTLISQYPDSLEARSEES